MYFDFIESRLFTVYYVKISPEQIGILFNWLDITLLTSYYEFSGHIAFLEGGEILFVLTQFPLSQTFAYFILFLDSDEFTKAGVVHLGASPGLWTISSVTNL